MSDKPSRRHIRAARASWATTPDRAARTAPARAAFLARFEREVDPDGTLDPAERERRATEARTAHFARLSALGVAARATERAPE